MSSQWARGVEALHLDRRNHSTHQFYLLQASELLNLNEGQRFVAFRCDCRGQNRFKSLAALRSHRGRAHRDTQSSSELRRYAVVVDESGTEAFIPIDAQGRRLPEEQIPTSGSPTVRKLLAQFGSLHSEADSCSVAGHR
jgi:hypothetical protein